MEDLEKSAISKKVFKNAEDLNKCHYDTGNPRFVSNSAKWTIASEFSSLDYTVTIRWPRIEPRTPRHWRNSYPCSCSCPGYTEQRGAKFCKHILLVLMQKFRN